MAGRLLIVVIGLIVVACGASPGKPGAGTPSTATGGPSAPAAPRAPAGSQAPTATRAPATPPAATAKPKPAATPPAALGTPGNPGEYGFQMVLLARANDWALVNATDGYVMTTVPAGVPTADWEIVYTATPNTARPTGPATQIKAALVGDSSSGQSWTVDGAWAIATVGLAHTSTGLSADGKTLVLVEANPLATTTRFAVLGTYASAAPRILSLPGRYAFDAISPDGSHFYVIEYRDAESGYFVRSVNTNTGSLDDGFIVDKREAAEVMAGIAIGQRQGSGGRVYTLYQGPEHPFVHLLETADRNAFCIDLPASWGNDQANAGAWSVAISADSTQLFVANAALGVVGEVDLNSLQVVRTTSFAPTASIQLAKFGGGKAGPAGRGMVLSPDRTTLYLADSTGVLAIATSDLSVKARLLPGRAVVSLGMAENGNVLYAVGRDGSAFRVDPSSGDIISTISGTGYTAVLRIVETG